MNHSIYFFVWQCHQFGINLFIETVNELSMPSVSYDPAIFTVQDDRPKTKMGRWTLNDYVKVYLLEINDWTALFESETYWASIDGIILLFEKNDSECTTAIRLILEQTHLKRLDIPCTIIIDKRGFSDVLDPKQLSIDLNLLDSDKLLICNIENPSEVKSAILCAPINRKGEGLPVTIQGIINMQ